MNHCDCYLRAHICCTERLEASVAEARLLVTKLGINTMSPGLDREAETSERNECSRNIPHSVHVRGGINFKLDLSPRL
jgi:hypothetical protein